MFYVNNKWGNISPNYSQSSVENNEENYFSQYCLDSSLHGLRYIGQKKRNFVEKIFWMVAFSVGVAVSIAFITQVWKKYEATPVITVFQPSQTSIDRITFPAITLCSVNNVIRSIAQEYTKAVDDFPNNVTAFTNLYLLDHVCRTSTTFSETFKFSQDRGNIRKEMKEELEECKIIHPEAFHNLTKTVTETLKDVSQKCSAMILLCMWNDEIANCNELFHEIETDFGYCCVFNMMPQSLLFNLRDDSRDNRSEVKEWADLDLDVDQLVDDENKLQTTNKFPYRQKHPGKTTGLSVLLDPDLDSYFCSNTDSQGFMALAHLPMDFPNIGDNGVAIKPNTETFLKINPEIIVADEVIKGFSLEKRRCYFGKEYTLKYFKYYTVSNCENECIANITYAACGCIRYFMPRNETQHICGARLYNCSERVRKRMLQGGLGRTCKMCLRTCNDIDFQMTTSYLPMRQDFPLWEYQNGTDAPWTNKNVSLLHIHYSVSSTYPKLRKELYGFIDLISNTGGILGLCLGFSALSLLGILYFVSLRLYCQTKSGQRLGTRLTNGTQKLWETSKSKIQGKTKKIIEEEKEGQIPYYFKDYYRKTIW